MLFLIPLGAITPVLVALPRSVFSLSVHQSVRVK